MTGALLFVRSLPTWARDQEKISLLSPCLTQPIELERKVLAGSPISGAVTHHLPRQMTLVTTGWEVMNREKTGGTGRDPWRKWWQRRKQSEK